MTGRFDRFRTHRQSRRWAGHDYASAGWYFVTVCTQHRRPLFGGIRGGVMGLNAAGCIAHACWAAIPDHAPGVRLDAFVVMPNHVHGLIGLVPTGTVATGHAPSLPMPGTAADGPDVGPSQPTPGTDAGVTDTGPTADAPSLGTVVGGFKSAVTRTVRRRGTPFAWQPRYHDHVVRNAGALDRIRTYIRLNPARWTADTFHPDDRTA